MISGEGATQDVPANGADMYVDGLAHEALSTVQPSSDLVRYSAVSDREVSGHDLILGGDAYDPEVVEPLETTIKRFRQPPISGKPLGTISLNEAVGFQKSS